MTGLGAGRRSADSGRHGARAKSRGASGRPAATVCATVLVVIAMLIASCGTDDEGSAAPADQRHADLPDDADPGWVGRVEGTNAFAAVVSGGGKVVAYVCDGDAGIAEWFSGNTDDDGSFALTSASGATLNGREGPDGLTGDLDLGNGTSHRIVLERAGPSAGLYRVEDPAADRDGVSAGWIVTNDGDQRGSLRIETTSRSAPPLPGSTLTLSDVDYNVVSYAVPTRPAPSAPAPVPIPYPNRERAS